MEFEFDPDKSAANRAKHGIDSVAAQALWRDPAAVEVAARSLDEPRWLVLGRIGAVVWTAVITRRGGRTRIISVGRARENERKIYLGG
jgi:uncharacterized DUF497 family protein